MPGADLWLPLRGEYTRSPLQFRRPLNDVAEFRSAPIRAPDRRLSRSERLWAGVTSTAQHQNARARVPHVLAAEWEHLYLRFGSVYDRPIETASSHQPEARTRVPQVLAAEWEHARLRFGLVCARALSKATLGACVRAGRKAARTVLDRGSRAHKHALGAGLQTTALNIFELALGLLAPP
jgi:hypothetical protein